MESTCIVLVIEGVDTIVYAIIVRTTQHLRAQLDKIGEEQENSSRSYKILHKDELFYYAKSNRKFANLRFIDLW